MEQKLLKHISAAYGLRYWKALGSSTYQTKGMNSIETGYQFILNQKLGGSDKGGYSKWISQNEQPSTDASVKTTATVAKFLSVIKEMIVIKDIHLIDALNFLRKKQGSDGRFEEQDLEPEATPSESTEHIAQTAYVVIAFLENTQYVEKFRAPIEKALKLLESNFDRIKSDDYALAISTYALALGERDTAETFLDETILHAITNTTQGYTYWNSTSLTTSKRIATAAYVILASAKLPQRVDDTTRMLKWLVSQKNEKGGFHSTDDTVVAIQAISVLAKRFYSKSNDINLKFKNDDFFPEINLKIVDQNPVSTVTIPTTSNEGVSVMASGTGVAFVQISQKYIIKDSKQDDMFKVQVKPKVTNNAVLILEVCVDPISPRKSTVLEVKMPSGYDYISHRQSPHIEVR